MSNNRDGDAAADGTDGQEKTEPRPDSLGQDLLDRLTPNQIAARDALLSGETVTQAADAVGVSRSTVSRWKNQSPDFRAALNRGKRQQDRRLRQQRIRVKEKALEKVEEGVERADAQMIELAVTEVSVEEPDEPLRTDPSWIMARERLAAAVREEVARLNYGSAMLLRLLGQREREGIVDRLSDCAAAADDAEQARKFEYAADFLEQTAEKTEFDGLAPEVVKEVLAKREDAEQTY